MARKKKQKPVELSSGSAPEGDLLYDFAAAAERDSKAKATVSVIAPASPPAPVRPVSITGPSNEEESDPDAWKRRAAARRLKANQASGAYGDPAAEEPVYTPRREIDPSPEFDRVIPPDEETGETLRRRAATGYRWRLLITAGILLSVWLLTSAGRLLWHQSNPPQASAGASQTAKRLQSEEIAGAVPAARTVVQAFFAAATAGEKQAFIRGGRALQPEMERYYAAHPDEPKEITLAANVEFMSIGPREFILIAGEDVTGAKFEVPVELTSAGPRIDWRAMKGTSEPWFKAWLEQRVPGRNLHRVTAMLDHLYTGPFAKKEEWLCLRVLDRDRTAAAWAYIPRSSSLAHRLLLNLQRSPQGVRICGEFEFPPAAGDTPGAVPQILLHRVEDHGWIDLSPEVQTASPPSMPP